MTTKILYVDDNEVNCMVFEEMLLVLFEDMEIDVFNSAKEVLAQNTEDYDVILSDIDMPIMDGYELYKHLREDKKFSKPIIAVTALAVSGDKEKILLHGFTDYLSKPIDILLLEEIINKYI